MAQENKVNYTKIYKDLHGSIMLLQNMFTAAEEFVRANYKCTDDKDRGIKIMGTINELIELKKLQESKGQKGQP